MHDETTNERPVESCHPDSESPVLTLDSCEPASNIPLSVSQTARPLIRRPKREEPFVVLPERKTLVVAIEQMKDEHGYYAGERFFPVPQGLHSRIGMVLRSVTFIAAYSAEGPFVLPLKLDPPGFNPNSWNTSLAEAVSQPAGQWITIWSDGLAKRYYYESVNAPIPDTPEYPDFMEDLERELKPNIIDSIDHPAIKQIKAAIKPAMNYIDPEEDIYE